MAEHILSFGPFTLAPSLRRLTRDGVALRLGSRALDVLIALIGRAGEVVSKDELIAAVWPNTFVDEANLRVHISALRKALGEDQLAAPVIENVPGRGYCFVAAVTRAHSPVDEVVAAADQPLTNLPLSLVRPLGRIDFIDAIVAQLPQRRLITIVGPGGMGKTTVAIAAAERLAGQFADGVAFVDLGTMTALDMVLPGILSAIEQVHGTVGPVRDLHAFLRGRQMLIVLDNCEHLIGEVATLAAQMLRACPDVRILTTSREPLRVPGEWVQRLPPLGLPPGDDDDVGRYPAVQLFVERASEALGGYELPASDASVVAEICRRLDGIALAIELAAGRMDTVGLAGIANSLDDRFRLLRQGRRTALPRHQTLRATIDWSFRLLSADEQAVLSALSIFSGGFTLEGARVVAGADLTDPDDLDDILVGLAAKSLIAADVSDSVVRYRLLETTRSYCAQFLAETERTGLLAERHARFVLSLFELAGQLWHQRSGEQWRETYAPEIGNLRVALDWAFSEHGDVSAGIALTVAAIPLWFQLSLVDERLTAARRAVRALDGQPDGDRRQRMQLNVVLGWPQMNAIADVESGPQAWRTVLTIAEELDEVDYVLRALWALWVDRTNSADHAAALALSQRFQGASASAAEPADAFIGQRMEARSLHMLGRQGEALAKITSMLAHYPPSAERAHAVRFQYDQRTCAKATLARVLFVSGFVEKALAEVNAMVETALALNDAPTLCHVLSDAACFIALFADDMPMAHSYIDLLEERTALGAMDVWHTYALACRGELILRSGDAETGSAMLMRAIDDLIEGGFVLHLAPFRGMLAQGLAKTGRRAEALDVIAAALADCVASGEEWYRPELMRIEASLRLDADADHAEGLLLAAGALAKEQGALAWQLRCVTSLAEVLVARGKSLEARAALNPVLKHMPEGYVRSDYQRAAALADTLA